MAASLRHYRAECDQESRSAHTLRDDTGPKFTPWRLLGSRHLAAVELRERLPGLPITESHPKALLYLQPEARPINSNSDHERDAILGAVAAWAMWSKQPLWRDLYADNHEPRWLVLAPLYYFMPIA